jgi:type IV secretory pathway VirB2 component (pilin)
MESSAAFTLLLVALAAVGLITIVSNARRTGHAIRRRIRELAELGKTLLALFVALAAVAAIGWMVIGNGASFLATTLVVGGVAAFAVCKLVL